MHFDAARRVNEMTEPLQGHRGVNRRPACRDTARQDERRAMARSEDIECMPRGVACDLQLQLGTPYGNYSLGSSWK
jgi:hypothetical protein